MVNLDLAGSEEIFAARHVVPVNLLGGDVVPTTLSRRRVGQWVGGTLFNVKETRHTVCKAKQALLKLLNKI